jgi:hypothetical protein
MNFSQGNHKLRLKNVYERENLIIKNRSKMTVTDHNSVVFLRDDKDHWGKADDCNCNYSHPKMVDMKLGKNLFCQLNCFYSVF